MCPAQPRPANRQRFDHGAAERFRLGGELQHQVARRIRLGDRGGRLGHRHGLLDAGLACHRLDLGQIVFASRLHHAGHPQARIDAGRAQPGQQHDRIGMTLQPGASTGQQQQRAVATKRRMNPGNASTRLATRIRHARERHRIDAARDHYQPRGIGGGIVRQQVIADRARHADDALAARHDRAVARRRIQSMCGGHETWSLPAHATQGPPAQPCRQARTRMHDIGIDLTQQPAQ